MDIIKLEIRKSENIILSISVAASLILWGWTLWKNQLELKEINAKQPACRSPGSPRTREMTQEAECTCKYITTRDDCLQSMEKNDWTGSDEEEIDTDSNIIPSASIKSTRQVMLNR